MRLHEDINESTIYCPFTLSIPSCQQLALTQVMKGLRPWLYSFTHVPKQSSTALFPILLPSRHNIPMQWVQVRQKWIRQINRDGSKRALQHLMCYRKILDFERKWNSALKLLLYCFSGPCIDLQPVSLTCIIYKMGPRRMNMFESLLIWSIFCYGCNSQWLIVNLYFTI